MSKKDKKRLVLLDAHAILHRAYHALPDFSTTEGEPTGALYGLSLMLLKIIDDLKLDYVVACYDLPGPTHRHEDFEDYKATRPETAEALKLQLKRSRDILDAFSIPWYECKGFEADDLLGTIVEQMKDDTSVDIVIASGDMDTLQLVDDKRVQVYTLRRGIKDTTLYDEDGVEERYGFGPELLPDYKGLRGDSSDNIPGVSGVGEKTATRFITTYGTIEEIYTALSEKSEEEVKEETGVGTRGYNAIKGGEDEALFSKALATIRRDAPIEFSLPERRWEDAFDPKAALELFSELEFRKLSDRLAREFDIAPEVRQKSFDELMQDIDERELTEMKVALWLLDSTQTKPTLDDILSYAGTRDFAEATVVILENIEKRGMREVFEDIEKPLIPVVEKMNNRGIKLDTDYFKQLNTEYHKKLADIQSRIHKTAGEEFNINSPQQLSEVLFEKLGLPTSDITKTKTGQYSTRESELKKLQGTHEIIDDIFDYRELQKLLSTYIDVFPQMADEDGRLHATFLQTGTTTGRMASQNPNLQNIPIKTKLGRAIRNGFVATEGMRLVALDYSQIELRIAAVLSGDEKLHEIFTTGRDVHTAVAADVFGVLEDEVTKNMRRKAKVINFGILYGMGVNALRTNLGDGTTRKEAQQYLDNYFEKYSGLAAWIEKIKRETARHGYTETMFGRRRYFPKINSKASYIRAQAERMAVNAPIQGTQADVIKRAMVEIDRWLTEEGLQADVHLLLQVHDELIYEVDEATHKEVARRIKEIMERIVPTERTDGIVFSAEVEAGPNWGELKSLAI